MPRFLRHVFLDDPLAGRPVVQEMVRMRKDGEGGVLEQVLSWPVHWWEPEEGGELLVVADNARVLALGCFGRDRDDDDTAVLFRLWTHSEHRRQGIGTRLLAELEWEIASLGYARVNVITHSWQPGIRDFLPVRGYTTQEHPAAKVVWFGKSMIRESLTDDRTAL